MTSTLTARCDKILVTVHGVSTLTPYTVTTTSSPASGLIKWKSVSPTPLVLRSSHLVRGRGVGEGEHVGVGVGEGVGEEDGRIKVRVRVSRTSSCSRLAWPGRARACLVRVRARVKG